MWPRSKLEYEFTRLHISYTKAREDIYQALYRYGPCRITDLVTLMDGTCGSRTVYRTVDLLLELKIAMRLSGGLVELAAPYKQHHHFLTCDQCGRRVGFYHEPLERMLERIAEGRGFTKAMHNVEFSGVCRTCNLKLS